MTATKRLLAAAATALAACAAAGPAAADNYTTDGVSVTPWFTDFETAPNLVGPFMMAADRSDRVYVTSMADGSLFRFGGPGPATPDKRLSKFSGRPAGLAFDANGKLYMARTKANDIVEVNTETGARKRTVAQGLPCPDGLAYDPISGGLVVSLKCTGEVLLVTDLASDTPRVDVLAKGPFAGGATNRTGRQCSRGPRNCTDGIAVARDGTVFVTLEDAIVEIQGTGSDKPGTWRVIDVIDYAEGITVDSGADGRPVRLVLNRLDGVITTIDLTNPAHPQRNIVTAGSSGRSFTVDSKGCLFASQLSEVIKITDPGAASCNAAAFTPTAPPAAPSEPEDLPSARGCVDTRKFSWRLHHRRGVRVSGVDIFVDGKRRVHKRKNHIDRVTLRRLPQGVFRVRIVATHSDETKRVTTRRYKGCKKGRPKGRRGGNRR